MEGTGPRTTDGAKRVGPATGAAWLRIRRRLLSPVAASHGTRSVVLSALVHAACIVPLLATSVLPSGRPVAPTVAIRATSGADVTPLREERAAPPPFAPPGRLEPEAAADDTPMAEPLLLERGLAGPRTAEDDPLRAADLSVRFAPRRAERWLASGSPVRHAPATAPVLVSGRYDAARDYPEVARRQGWEGVVSFELVVDAEGRVHGFRLLEVARGSLADAAAEITRAWLFQPATRDGEPVMGYHRDTIDFRLERGRDGRGPRGGEGRGEGWGAGERRGEPRGDRERPREPRGERRGERGRSPGWDREWR